MFKKNLWILYVIIVVSLMLYICCDLSNNDGTSPASSDNETENPSAADTTAPQVISITPAGGTAGIEFNEQIVLIFDESLNSAVLGVVSFKTPGVTFQNGINCSMVFNTTTLNHDTLSIAPNDTFTPGSTWSDLAVAGFEDASGNVIDYTDSSYGFSVRKLQIVTVDGKRQYEDGTYAVSAESYRRPDDSRYCYEGDTGSGIYQIKPLDTVLDVYADMEYDDGGWTLVLLNSLYATPPTPEWSDCINSNNITGDMTAGLTAFDQLLGLEYWNYLGTQWRVEMGSEPSDIDHRTLYTGSLDADNYYALDLDTDSEQVLIHTTGTESPGLYTYHNGCPFSAMDSDHDKNTSQCCCCNYSYTPWWYNNCWSGSFWGGGTETYQNKPYWSGSSTEYFDWGAIWIR